MAEAAFAGAPALRMRPWLLRAVLAGLIAVACAVAMPRAALAQTYSFSTVAVEGTQRIEPGTVLSYAEIPRGQAISAGELNDAYQRVLGSGLFEQVEFVPQGGRLVIRVTEFPTINVVDFEGNRRIDDEALSAVVRSQSRRVYSPTVAEQDAAAITEAYSQAGRFAATVTPRIIRRSENRVDLVFEIVEGRVVENERISFVGNRNFSDRRLRQVLETKQAGLFRQLVQRDTFVADRIEFDKQLLRDFYLSRGYVDFEVLSVNSEITRRRDAFFITFNVREGQQFRFGEITTVSEIPEADAAEYEREIRIRSGGVYSPTLVDNTIARLETLALRQGLDFVRVEPRVSRNDRAQTLDIEFAIVRGPRIFVERIDIEGNVTTLDRVVRQRFRTVEGDPFNPREIRESAERIRALGYFSSAEVSAREGSSPEQVVVDVDVEEQPTGSLGFGLSYSVSSGAAFAVNFSESNFLGRGQTLAFALDTGTTNSNSRLTFIEPYFLGRDLRFSSNIFYRESSNDFSDYSTRTGGLSLGLEFPAGENSRLGFTVGARFDSLFDVDPASSPILIAEEDIGDRYMGLFGVTYSYDTRAGGLDPTRGVLLRFSNELYGGDASYLKSTIQAVAEAKVRNEEVTLRASFEGGAISVIDGQSRVTDRFFGSEMRGFEPRGIGPRDLDTAGEDPLGGNYFAVAKFEAEFPLGLPEEYGITGGLFLDVGTVWGLDDTDGAGGAGSVDDSLHLRAAAGFSVFWTTPLGPLRFNFSTPIEKLDYDKEQNFDLSVSTRF
ncbi:MAG: outer membrane protein assembly factor BamA [Rhodobacteraceae bacterium]|jgi:outer membrane protein insertion porin family|nr:outer membrane protein assembly factor BamA [Paracoccaceae bacterium]